MRTPESNQLQDQIEALLNGKSSRDVVDAVGSALARVVAIISPDMDTARSNVERLMHSIHEEIVLNWEAAANDRDASRRSRLQ